MDLMDAALLFLIEIKTEHISLVDVIIIKISDKLFFAPAVILFAMPDFHFDDILIPAIIHDHVCSAQIARACFYIIVARTADDRSEIKQKIFPALILAELFIMITINICEMNGEFFKDLSSSSILPSEKIKNKAVLSFFARIDIIALSEQTLSFTGIIQEMGRDRNGSDLIYKKRLFQRRDPVGQERSHPGISL